jgi:pimeloyl-ACP methyl ester carboxylesterase
MRYRAWFVWGCVLLGMGSALAQTELRLQDIEFTAACDGSVQRYVLALPEPFDSDRTYDLLIALHGHGSDRWQFARDPRDECRAARDAAREHAMIFVSPDYRAKTSWMGPQAEADIVQIIQDLKKAYPVRRTFLCGGSMGGSSALTFTALHPELIDGVAAMNGTANHLEYDQFQDAIQASFGGKKQEKPMEYKQRSAEYWPERFTMPVAISAGGKDTLVPPGSVLRLADVLAKMGRPPLLLYREDGGHATTYDDGKALIEYVVKRTTRSSAR